MIKIQIVEDEWFPVYSIREGKDIDLEEHDSFSISEAKLKRWKRIEKQFCKVQSEMKAAYKKVWENWKIEKTRLTISRDQIKFKNVNSYDEKKLKKLLDDIRIHGILEPIILDTENNLLDGMYRLRCCDLLNIDSIPVSYRRIEP